jgi:hypothetical protein
MSLVTPLLRATDLEAIDAIERLRDDLRYYRARPRRLYGTLGRAVLARAVQGRTRSRTTMPASRTWLP